MDELTNAGPRSEDPGKVGRMVLLIVGVAFGATIAHFFAKGIFGS